MDILEIKMSDINSFDSVQLREVEKDLRKQLAEVRLDVYTNPASFTGKIRKLKKNLARVLTVQSAAKTVKQA